MPTLTRDSQRARVYRAEDDWAGQLDAARLGAPLARVAGSSLLLPAERRFGTLDTAARYLERVVRLPAVVAAVGPVDPPGLRTRRGQRCAHWEAPGLIAVPVPAHGEPWAMRESVLLHELAHHLAWASGRPVRHGAPFPALLLLLAGAALGAHAELALRVHYGEHGVEVGSL